MDTQVGDNAAAMLRGMIDKLYDLRVDETKLKGERKDLVEDLGNEGFPVKFLLAEPETDEEVEARKKCAVIMGHTVYAEELPQDDATTLLEELGEEKVDYVNRGLDNIKAVDDGLKLVKEQIKETLKEVKKAGYAPRIVKILVDFKVNPKKAAKFDKDSPLLAAYRAAVGS